jgi:hypothetical protein
MYEFSAVAESPNTLGLPFWLYVWPVAGAVTPGRGMAIAADR